MTVNDTPIKNQSATTVVRKIEKDIAEKGELGNFLLPLASNHSLTVLINSFTAIDFFVCV
ncbi:hypothetical protein BI308_05060 [Roseofilum reptotaenium AO1-A]|uniref:Uncharacterized protein n=1 Tax=Roseofilum reptotaenium AO1-A TaxID=1925591 RepID=A0A1L9QVP6_9CYAN|nr:hypothetical protein BI308_05060 [Roseofilum reptotaenium AO1-A]